MPKLHQKNKACLEKLELETGKRESKINTQQKKIQKLNEKKHR